MRYLILNILFLHSLFSYDKLYFLPKDNKIAKENIINLIKNSKNSINLAIYNISYNKFIKELNKASLKGIKVNIFYTKKDNKFNKNINLFKTKSKLHTKIAIFDKKIVIFGSANWKKKSFDGNYEVINITNNKEKVDKFNQFFKQLKGKN